MRGAMRHASFLIFKLRIFQTQTVRPCLSHSLCLKLRPFEYEFEPDRIYDPGLPLILQLPDRILERPPFALSFPFFSLFVLRARLPRETT